MSQYRIRFNGMRYKIQSKWWILPWMDLGYYTGKELMVFHTKTYPTIEEARDALADFQKSDIKPIPWETVS